MSNSINISTSNKSLRKGFSPKDEACQMAAMSRGLVFSEFRSSGALIEALGERIFELLREANPLVTKRLPDICSCTSLSELPSIFNARASIPSTDTEKKLPTTLIPLFRHFSLQLELAQTALLREIPKDHMRDEFSSLVMELRTYAEEAIVRCERDPLGIAVEYLCNIRIAHKLAGEMKHSSFGNNVCIPGGFTIQEFSPLRTIPSTKVLSDLSTICKELAIDNTRIEEQEGFAKQISPVDLENYLAIPGARLFLARYNGSAIGLFIVTTAPEGFPDYVSKAIRVETGTQEFPSKGDGWAMIVGLSRTGRDALASINFRPYPAFTAAVVETSRALGIERLWGEVRTGLQANTSIDKHIDLGWINTGISTFHDTHPYQVLLLHLPSYATQSTDGTYYWGYHSKNKDQWLEKYREITSLCKDFDYRGLTASTVPDFDQNRLNNLTPIQQAISKQTGKPVDCHVEVVGDTYHISVLSSTESGYRKHLIIKQKVPGKDLWKLEEHDYYLLGVNREMQSLSEIVSHFDELRRH